MKVHPTLLAFAWALILCPISLPADLKSYQATWEKQFKSIVQDHDAKIAALQVQYEKGLSALKARAQKEGNLAKVNGVVAEMKRFQKEKAVSSKISSKQLPGISNLQKIYSKQALRFEMEGVNGVVTLTTQYDRALVNYQKTLVKSGKFDEANAVEEERKRIQQSNDHAGAKKAFLAFGKETTTPKKPDRVPADAKSFGGHWYKVYEGRIVWHDARKKCKGLGGHLAIINDDAENKFLVELMKASSKEGAFVGATDETREGKWTWVDGSPMKFKKWGNGLPDGGDYLVFTHGWWLDNNKVNVLSKNHAFICEWE